MSGHARQNKQDGRQADDGGAGGSVEPVGGLQAASGRGDPDHRGHQGHGLRGAAEGPGRGGRNDQQVGLLQQRPRQQDALELPAGKIRDLLSAQPGDAGLFQGLAQFLSRVATRQIQETSDRHRQGRIDGQPLGHVTDGQARLARVDVVFWVSDDLTPWLARAQDLLADEALKVELMPTPGTRRLAYRQGATFEAHDHGHDDHEHDDHGHDDHGHSHAHEGLDPHGWLDPVNAQAWLEAIAESLADLDPDNADVYRQNTAEGQDELDTLIDELSDRLAAARGTHFVVFHDAYQYFENRFDVPSAGAISLGDASDPSPARIREIQERVTEQGIQCVFRELQFNPALIESVFEGTDVETSIIIDPLGVDLPLGAELYPQLMRQLADGVLRCSAAS